MKIQIDPKVDYAFKHVFGREESKPALISLVDAVLQPAAGQYELISRPLPELEGLAVRLEKELDAKLTNGL